MNVEEQAENCILNKNFKSPPKKNLCKLKESDNTKSISQQQTCNASTVSTNEAFSKHSKRKIIKSHFDQSRKRKFPGPAGLLSKTLEETKNESICHLELLSQVCLFHYCKCPCAVRLYDVLTVYSLIILVFPIPYKIITHHT